MKFNKKNGTNSVVDIKNALTYLHLDSIDKQFSEFVEKNFDFFYVQTDKPSISFVNNNSFKLVREESSEFSVTFVPNCISPEKIMVELINLDGDSVLSYTINYIDEDTLEIIRRHSLRINDIYSNKKTHKKYEKTRYVNSRIAYKRSIENIVCEENDNSCSKEITIYYPNFDERYVKSQISIGMENSFYPTSVRYEKFDGKSVKSINETEFNNLKVKKHSKNKVLKINKIVA